MLCKKCQKEIPDESKFCLFCGKELEEKPRTRSTHRRPSGEGCVFHNNGCKTWTLRLTIGFEPSENGFKQTFEQKGGFATKREAYAYIPAMRAEIESRQRATSHGVDYTKITFEDLYTKMMARDEKEQRIVKSTLDCYKAAYKYFSDIHHMRFIDLNTEDFQLCVDDCPRRLRTKENMKALGTKLYKYANELRVFGTVTQTDFATFVWLDKEDKESRQPFTLEELTQLKGAISNGVPFAQYIFAMCVTGFRPSEFLALQHDAYDPQTNTLRGGSKTEAGKNRIVPVHPIIKPFVAERYLSQKKFLFGDASGDQFTVNYFREKCFYPALADAGIQNIPTPDARPNRTPYSCRHTFATHMKDVSGSNVDKAAIMGHTSYEMTMHYQHEDFSSLNQIVSGMKW